MPELPDAQRIPQPSPRLVTRFPPERTQRSGSTTGRYQNLLFPPGYGNRPTTILIGGSSRSVVNGVAFAVAEMLDLTPFWLDVRDPSTPTDGGDPATIGWIPADRLFVSENGHGLEPGTFGAKHSLWSIVRSDEPASVLSHLTDFLQLPELLQEIVSASVPAGGSRALVVANSDRVAHLFPRTAEGLHRFLGTLVASSISIVAAHTGPPSPGRFGFATVLRVDARSPASWMEGTLVCEQGIDQGPFAIGRLNRLSDVPSVARVLNGLFPQKR